MCPEMECIVFPFFQYTVRILRSICKANSALKNIPEFVSRVMVCFVSVKILNTFLLRSVLSWSLFSSAIRMIFGRRWCQ